MDKKRRRNNLTADMLKDEFERGFAVGYAKGRKAAAVSKPPVCYVKGYDGKWYVFPEGEKRRERKTDNIQYGNGKGDNFRAKDHDPARCEDSKLDLG